jgi:hypothetical protein
MHREIWKVQLKKSVCQRYACKRSAYLTRFHLKKWSYPLPTLIREEILPKAVWFTRRDCIHFSFLIPPSATSSHPFNNFCMHLSIHLNRCPSISRCTRAPWFCKPFHMYSAMEHSCLETTGWMAARDAVMISLWNLLHISLIWLLTCSSSVGTKWKIQKLEWQLFLENRGFKLLGCTKEF